MLQLTDGGRPARAGVEIVAQPPGKKLVNLEAMSGGEKTMTAVTLLFALFMHRPRRSACSTRSRRRSTRPT
jgi:chromosome segregation protein